MPSSSKTGQFHSEEDVKNKVILPFLAEVGIATGEISFESPVKVQIGRKLITLYSDILVLNRGRPFILVETKRSRHKLTEVDQMQALQYAASMDAIPPVVILTNGKTTRFFDPISKQQLERAREFSALPYWTSGFNLDIDKHLQLQMEALTSFIAYSSENVTTFAIAQREYRQSHLVEPSGVSNKKILRELFVRSTHVEAAWDTFLRSGFHSFVLRGEPGVGKSNHLWALAERSSLTNFCFFLDAGRVTDPLWDELQSDFNWSFSSSSSYEQIVRRLASIARASGREMIFFLDSIDESASPDFALQVDNLCRRLSDHGIRTVLTCRTFDWSRFTEHASSPTWLAENAAVHDLAGFTTQEVLQAWNLYSKAFQVSGVPSTAVLESAQDPFTLRVICEVFTRQAIPDHIDVPDLLRKFVDLRLASRSNSRSLKNILVRISHLFFEKGSHTLTEGEVGDLPGWTERVKESLLSSDLIILTLDNFGRNSMRFANGPVLSYLIGLMAGRWDTLTSDKFRLVADVALDSAVGQNTLAWFLRYFPRYQDQVGDSVKGRAFAYITRRDQLIDEWFAPLRQAFAPKTIGHATIEVVTGPGGVPIAWSLIPLDAHGSRVLTVPAPPEDLPYRSFSDVPTTGQVSHFGSDSLAPKDAGKHLLREFEDILRNPPVLPVHPLVDERIFAEVAPFATELGIEGIERCVGGIWRGSFSRDQLTTGIWKWVSEWHRRVPSLTHPIPVVLGHAPNIQLLLDLLSLTESLQFSPLLPLPDVTNPSNNYIESSYSFDQKRAWLSELFALSAPALRELATSYFPQLSRRFQSGALNPFAIVWNLSSPREQERSHLDFCFVYGLAADSGLEAPDLTFGHDPFRASFAGRSYHIRSHSGTSFIHLLIPTNNMGLPYQVGDVPIAAFCWDTIRSWFPRHLLDEIFPTSS